MTWKSNPDLERVERARVRARGDEAPHTNFPRRHDWGRKRPELLRRPPPGTVRAIVFRRLRDAHASPSGLNGLAYETVERAVRANFPESRFNRRHLSVYKSQFLAAHA